ncbi:MAG TPA: hypothetical protein VL688_09805 [Verrucomicrobiae bacterium]|jgi:hypothetical protein|nr:hypothetical protein [Verrucomicrobiae bacterium]
MKLKLDFHDVGWWYWLATWIMITAGLAGWEAGFYMAAGLAAWQIGHYARLEKNPKAFSVQVRAGFFLLMVLGFIRPLRFIYWIPFTGLIARLLVNYCCLARAMSLLPWNRKEPLSAGLLRRTFLSPPTDGPIVGP